MSTKRHEQPPTAPAVSAPAAAPPIPSPTAPPAVSVPTEAARDAPRGGAAANNGRKRKNLGRNEYK